MNLVKDSAPVIQWESRRDMIEDLIEDAIEDLCHMNKYIEDLPASVSPIIITNFTLLSFNNEDDILIFCE